MGGEFDALGDAVTGALVARAVEPGAGEIGPDGRTHETHCLNCKTELVGDFCHACGQHAHVRRTLTSLIHDFLHGLLNFEGKIWRTLPLLAWKPGELTRRYIEGQRATFVSPIALFLFSVFLMFAAVETTNVGKGQAPQSVQQNLAQQIAADGQRLAQARARPDSRRQGRAARPSGSTSKIADVKAELTAIKAVKDKGIPAAQFHFDDNDQAPRWLSQSVEAAAKNPGPHLLQAAEQRVEIQLADHPVVGAVRVAAVSRSAAASGPTTTRCSSLTRCVS